MRFPPSGCRLADAGHEPDNPVVTDDVIAPDRFTLYGAWVRQVWTLQNAIVSAMKTSVWIGGSADLSLFCLQARDPAE